MSMRITPEIKSALNDILSRRARIAEHNEQIKEDVKALAERLKVKPAVVTKMLGLIEKERGRGDVISAERDILDAADECTG